MFSNPALPSLAGRWPVVSPQILFCRVCDLPKPLRFPLMWLVQCHDRCSEQRAGVCQQKFPFFLRLFQSCKLTVCTIALVPQQSSSRIQLLSVGLYQQTSHRQYWKLLPVCISAWVLPRLQLYREMVANFWWNQPNSLFLCLMLFVWV